jgi:hypothetical protein
MYESPVVRRTGGANRSAAHFRSGNTAATLFNKPYEAAKYNAEF